MRHINFYDLHSYFYFALLSFGHIHTYTHMSINNYAHKSHTLLPLTCLHQPLTLYPFVLYYKHPLYVLARRLCLRGSLILIHKHIWLQIHRYIQESKILLDSQFLWFFFFAYKKDMRTFDRLNFVARHSSLVSRHIWSQRRCQL